jgi:N-acyl-D-amino-acid deacylase
VIDLLLTGGLVFDGTGAPPHPGALAIQGDRIAAVGAAEGPATCTLDVSGCWVVPGFIDVHGHSDSTIFLARSMESKVRQGVTTEVIGNCGASLAPLTGEARELVARELAGLGVPLEWQSVAEYLRALAEGGLAINVALLVGHDVLRYGAVGSAARPADRTERRAMQAALAQALDEGACGLSLGLAYAPGVFADQAELVALAEVVAGSGLLAVHLRDEGEQLHAAIAEVLAVARTSGVRLEISHLKASGRRQHGTLPQVLRWLAAERANGLDLGWDIYPYTAASTTLAATLPPWLHADGPAAFLARLDDPATLERLREDEATGAWTGLARDAGWDGIVVTGARGRPDATGQTIAALAAQHQRDPWEEVVALLRASGGSVGCLFFTLAEEDVAAAIDHPLTVFGSDSAARVPRGALGRGRPHPRGYGTFPRLLRRAAAQPDRAADLIHRLTGLPAERFGLAGRGVLQPGAAADVVVVDPRTVADRATYDQPHQFPEGIRWVIVNGTVVADPAGQRAVLPGRVLRRG